MWEDWLAAMVLAADQTGVPERFAWSGPDLDHIAAQPLLPFRIG
ncbi:MAG: hypothetical protein R3C44_16995 [Chloroflexota bacterium]